MQHVSWETAKSLVETMRCYSKCVMQLYKVNGQFAVPRQAPANRTDSIQKLVVTRDLATLHLEITDFKTKLAAASGELRSMQMRRNNISMMEHWVAALEVYDNSTQTFYISALTKQIALLATKTENACPRCTTSITDTVYNREVASLQLGNNKEIGKIPGAVQLIWNLLSDLSKVTESLGLGSAEKSAFTMHESAMGKSALSFGTKTVNMAAAVRTIDKTLAEGLTKDNQEAIDKRLTKQAYFPAALTKMLQQLQQGNMSTTISAKDTKAVKLTRNSTSASSTSAAGAGTHAKRQKTEGT